MFETLFHEEVEALDAQVSKITKRAPRPVWGSRQTQALFSTPLASPLAWSDTLGAKSQVKDHTWQWESRQEATPWMPPWIKEVSYGPVADSCQTVHTCTPAHTHKQCSAVFLKGLSCSLLRTCLGSCITLLHLSNWVIQWYVERLVHFKVVSSWKRTHSSLCPHIFQGQM